MAKKETSDRVSAIAADLMNITNNDITWAVAEGTRSVTKLRDKIRAVAASALGQDETKGKR